MTEAASTIDRLLRACLEAGASDLHVSPGLPPHLRRHGDLSALAGEPVVSAESARAWADELVIRSGLTGVEALGDRGSVDGAVTFEGARFRFNVFRRQGLIALAVRRLDDRFRTLGELGLPESLLHFCTARDGLVIVAGPTGAGKSTTLATLIDHVNGSRSGHIITIEDPVEYLHAPRRCIVNQRQIGMDASGFHIALVSALRQDPDVVLVGEIRDLDTIRTAITAAETGHLVFTTLHAGDAVGAVERLVSVFPADEQDGIRRQLALVLRGIVVQRLLPAEPATSRDGRVACSEILVNTPAVANLIANARPAQIHALMEAGASHGMQTLEQDLARLWTDGRISEVTAMAASRNPANLRERATLLRSQRGGLIR